MDLPVMPPVRPMLAKAVHELPPGDDGDLAFEPKWDGFRCIIFRDGDEVELGSRNQRPFTRYFPELVDPIRQILPERCVVDGELVVPGPEGLDFDALGQRIHPAESRVRMLAEATPASFVAFDLLALGDRDLRPEPFVERRRVLVEIGEDFEPPIMITASTTDREVAQEWFDRFEGAGFDGVMAKPAGGAYVENKRTQFKVKQQRTADCVVAGYRVHKSGDGVGSLLLGAYDDAGDLHHLGVASSFKAADRPVLLTQLAKLHLDDLADHPWGDWGSQTAETADGRMPGGPNRWNAQKDMSWTPIEPILVAEVRYEHATGGRFRGVARLSRWRADRDPLSCHVSQLDHGVPDEIHDIFEGTGDKS
jgi:ATP-dependent DNA ligase